jgi:RimJ/RimL family protein N-acetyltransferase
MPYDYNKRSCKMLEKCGFEIIKTKQLPDGMKGKIEIHYILSKEKYINRADNQVYY